MAQLHPDTLPRQWQMLRMIPRYPQKITAKSLHEKLQAEQFDVTKRTVERDLLALSKMFPLVSDERDKPYDWSWSKDAPVFNLPGLSHNEALTLAMVETPQQPASLIHPEPAQALLQGDQTVFWQHFTTVSLGTKLPFVPARLAHFYTPLNSNIANATLLDPL